MHIYECDVSEATFFAVFEREPWKCRRFEIDLPDDRIPSDR